VNPPVALISKVSLHDFANLSFFMFCEIFPKTDNFVNGTIHLKKKIVLFGGSCNFSVKGCKPLSSVVSFFIT